MANLFTHSTYTDKNLNPVCVSVIGFRDIRGSSKVLLMQIEESIALHIAILGTKRLEIFANLGIAAERHTDFVAAMFDGDFRESRRPFRSSFVDANIAETNTIVMRTHHGRQQFNLGPWCRHSFQSTLLNDTTSPERRIIFRHHVLVKDSWCLWHRCHVQMELERFVAHFLGTFGIRVVYRIVGVFEDANKPSERVNVAMGTHEVEVSVVGETFAYTDLPAMVNDALECRRNGRDAYSGTDDHDLLICYDQNNN